MTLKQVSKNLNSGQAIVIVALAAIGLIAMMGLAIDGGRLLLLRRDTQNAADAAAIAASRALCAGRDPVVAGIAAADANGYNNDEVADTVVINHPPNPIPSGIGEAACADCFVEVTVNGEIPPTFIGLVYGGDLAATSHAIGTCNPDLEANSHEAPEVRAAWAKGECAANAVSITGDTITVEGGLHSNAEMKIMPGGAGGEIVGATSVVTAYKDDEPVQVNDKVTWYPTTSSRDNEDNNAYIGGCTAACFISTPPDTDIIPPDGEPYVTEPKENYPVDFDITQFQSPGGTYYQAAMADGNKYYEFTTCDKAGDFWDWVETNHMTGTALHDGLYYTTCPIVIDKDVVTGKVTFVTTDTINVKGNGQQWTPYVSNAKGNELLLFAGKEECGGEGAIKFSGNNNAWNGIIFAPGGDINMSASTNNSSAGCLIGQTVQVAGSSNKIICDTGEPEADPLPVVFLSE